MRYKYIDVALLFDEMIDDLNYIKTATFVRKIKK